MGLPRNEAEAQANILASVAAALSATEANQKDASYANGQHFGRTSLLLLGTTKQSCCNR
jgi:hypothetical protein